MSGNYPCSIRCEGRYIRLPRVLGRPGPAGVAWAGMDSMPEAEAEAEAAARNSWTAGGLWDLARR